MYSRKSAINFSPFRVWVFNLVISLSIPSKFIGFGCSVEPQTGQALPAFKFAENSFSFCFIISSSLLSFACESFSSNSFIFDFSKAVISFIGFVKSIFNLSCFSVLIMFCLLVFNVLSSFCFVSKFVFRVLISFSKISFVLNHSFSLASSVISFSFFSVSFICSFIDEIFLLIFSLFSVRVLSLACSVSKSFLVFKILSFNSVIVTNLPISSTWVLYLSILLNSSFVFSKSWLFSVIDFEIFSSSEFNSNIVLFNFSSLLILLLLLSIRGLKWVKQYSNCFILFSVFVNSSFWEFNLLNFSVACFNSSKNFYIF